MKRRLVLAAAGLLLAACGTAERSPAVPRPTPSPAASATLASLNCPGAPAATVSYQPPASLPTPGDMPAGSTMADIVKRGRLVVGTSADTRLLSARKLGSNQLEGFDIEMSQRVAQAIFGDSSNKHLTFKTISAGNRIPFLQDGSVDMVARAMTMTCDRWKNVEFSAPYFLAAQRVLVRANAEETSLPQLAAAGKRVCATTGSTSIARLAQFKGIKPMGATLTTDCMVLWQQGKVDAITGDDAILAGLAQQDPTARVSGPPDVEDEPYGLAVKKGAKDFAAFINGVLAQMSRDGDWQTAYKASGLQSVLGSRSQPKPQYGRS